MFSSSSGGGETFESVLRDRDALRCTKAMYEAMLNACAEENALALQRAAAARTQAALTEKRLVELEATLIRERAERADLSARLAAIDVARQQASLSAVKEGIHVISEAFRSRVLLRRFAAMSSTTHLPSSPSNSGAIPPEALLQRIIRENEIRIVGHSALMAHASPARLNAVQTPSSSSAASTKAVARPPPTKAGSAVSRSGNASAKEGGGSRLCGAKTTREGALSSSSSSAAPAPPFVESGAVSAPSHAASSFSTTQIASLQFFAEASVGSQLFRELTEKASRHDDDAIMSRLDALEKSLERELTDLAAVRDGITGTLSLSAQVASSWDVLAQRASEVPVLTSDLATARDELARLSKVAAATPAESSGSGQVVANAGRGDAGGGNNEDGASPSRHGKKRRT